MLMGQIYSYIYRILKRITYRIVVALSYSNLGQGYESNAVIIGYELECIGDFDTEKLERSFGLVRSRPNPNPRIVNYNLLVKIGRYIHQFYTTIP